MDLASPKTIKGLMAKYGKKPSKGMGQNFLVDAKVLQKIIGAAELLPTETVVEIGPGLGVLTKELAKRASKVVAIEKDRGMLNILQETVGSAKNIEVISGDVLKLSIFNDQFPNYKMIANIPYYLTSPLIRKFLEAENQPSKMVLMIQKEVAQRICAKPPHMSLLAVSVQYYADPKIISYVKKECFWPAPKVDSAIIKIMPHTDTRRRASDSFFRVVKAGFSQPRKQLANNLSRALKMPRENAEAWLRENGIDPKRRAETLSIEEWKRLAENQNISTD